MPSLSQRPRLAPFARLKFDHVGDQWLLLSPERGLILSPTARAVLELCDGSRRFSDVVAELSARFTGAPPSEIARDVLELAEALERRALLLLDE